MVKKTFRVLIALLLVCVLGFPPSPVANACGPYLAEAVFTDMKAPDNDYGEYLQGKLGIIQPSYYDQFLYAAYRQLSGVPFTKQELEALNPSMKANPANPTSANYRGPAEQSQPIETEEVKWHVAVGDKDWERKNYPDPQGVIRSESHDGSYIEFYNCLPDAFRTARERLQKHRDQFGTESAAVSSWLEAQKQVFANCGAPFKYNAPPMPAVIPVSAAESDPAVIRFDRKYQIAAAYFYAGAYDTAAAQFGELAKMDDSPWRGIATYLQARALIRKGTIGDNKGNLNRDALLEAEKLLKQIVADPKEKTILEPSQRRLNLLAARLRPEERRAELAAKLMKPGDTNFDQDQTDYFWLLDHTSRTIGGKEDVTNWIFTMKDKSANSFGEAFRRWQETKSLAWMVASLCKANLNSTGISELLQAAAGVPQGSPGYATLEFHKLRLGKGVFKDKTAIAELDGVLQHGSSGLPISARNEFLALRMTYAESFDEFLQFAPRKPAGVAYSFGTDDDGVSLANAINADDKKPGYRFDADAAAIFSERIPLVLLAKAAGNEKVPLELQRMLTLAAWTRAVLLRNDAIAKELGPRAVQFAPELGPAFDSYLSAVDPDARSFAAVYALLKSPGLRPFVDSGIGRDAPTDKLDNLRDNWWCSFAPPANKESFSGSYRDYPWRAVSPALRSIYPDGKIPSSQFFSDSDSKQAAIEFESLARLPSAPDWLGIETIAFAKSHPEDPRVPEALHLIVRATRLGCSTENTGNTSKAAFDLLHKKYADDPWTKKTPYWYQ